MDLSKLLDYSDDDDDGGSGGDGEHKSNKISGKIDQLSAPVNLPPLPSAFHNLYASTVRVSITDDPSLHGGRVRQVPHVEGNYPTHVYIEWYPPKGAVSLLQHVVNRPRASTADPLHVTSLITNDLSCEEPLHISLSRSLVLRKEDHADFIEAIKNAISSSGVRPFDIGLRGLKWHPNYDRSRYFLSVGLVKPQQDQLNRLLWCINRAVATRNHPMLYYDNGTRAKPSDMEMRDCSQSFHVSIAWTLQQPPVQEPSLLDEQQPHAVAGNIEHLCINVDRVKVKIGDKVHEIILGAKPTIAGSNFLGI